MLQYVIKRTAAINLRIRFRGPTDISSLANLGLDHTIQALRRIEVPCRDT